MFTVGVYRDLEDVQVPLKSLEIQSTQANTSASQRQFPTTPAQPLAAAPEGHRSSLELLLDLPDLLNKVSAHSNSDDAVCPHLGN